MLKNCNAVTQEFLFFFSPLCKIGQDLLKLAWVPGLPVTENRKISTAIRSWKCHGRRCTSSWAWELWAYPKSGAGMPLCCWAFCCWHQKKPNNLFWLVGSLTKKELSSPHFQYIKKIISHTMKKNISLESSSSLFLTCEIWWVKKCIRKEVVRLCLCASQYMSSDADLPSSITSLVWSNPVQRKSL